MAKSSAGSILPSIQGENFEGLRKKMNLGRIIIKMPDGSRREHILDRPQVIIGRAPDNDIVIEHTTISRRHARLSPGDEVIYIEDLGSTNGTYIDRQILERNRLVPIMPGQSILLGEIEIEIIPPTLQSQAEETVLSELKEPGDALDDTAPVRSGAQKAGPEVSRVEITLRNPPEPVVPGSTSSTILEIHNHTDQANEFIVRVTGIPSNWVRIGTDRIYLEPGRKGEIIIHFIPPRHTEAYAGEHHFKITVYTEKNVPTDTLLSTLTILPYYQTEINLEPTLESGTYQVILTNLGNVPITYRLAAKDTHQKLDFKFQQDFIELSPGGRGVIPLIVTTIKRPIISSNLAHTFSVTAQPVAGGVKEVSKDGEIIVKPYIPLWALPIVLFLLLCACGTAAFAYTRLCQSADANLPFCPGIGPPVINTFIAEPEEIEMGGEVTIVWEVSNADIVELVSPALEIEEPVEDQSSLTISLTETTTFTLRASNREDTIEESLVVIVIGSPPLIVSFTVEPGAIVEGQVENVRLEWEVANADEVTIEGISVEPLPLIGNLEVPAPSTDTTYILVASNQAGTVQQEFSVFVISAGCIVSDLAIGDLLSVYAGPDTNHPILAELSGGTSLEPKGRTQDLDWLNIGVADLDGWVLSQYVTCVVQFHVFPTVMPELIPTPIPTETPSPTPEPTPTSEPTGAPVILSTGVISYRVQSPEGVSIFAQGQTGNPIPLVTNKSDAGVLDFTPHNDGRFAIWVLEGNTHSVYIVLANGQQIGNPLNPGWESVIDAHWSMNGQRLVVEAIRGGNPSYYYFTANGELTGNPTFP